MYEKVKQNNNTVLKPFRASYTFLKATTGKNTKKEEIYTPKYHSKTIVYHRKSYFYISKSKIYKHRVIQQPQNLTDSLQTVAYLARG